MRSFDADGIDPSLNLEVSLLAWLNMSFQVRFAIQV